MRPEFDHVAYHISGLDNGTVGPHLWDVYCLTLDREELKNEIASEGMSRFAFTQA